MGSAVPGAPGIDIAQKPHHDDWEVLDGDGPWRGHGRWGGGGWYPDVNACISATGPYGYVTGFVWI
ncbi:MULTISPECIES: hypothetical protein [Mycolicibacterium]|uniref:hypothetical protein n=1 Tax=Mycolicibacterium TaxID=1866885 RepID=UPI0011C03921|nr:MULTISPECIES: hypothetical protein [Mycolicibacterium]MBV5242445.1 hypothetical protein [Mycolicibacterium sp. PAM1]MCV7056327.1 hypothetical protein [Mycolicibacterium gilvum]